MRSFWKNVGYSIFDTGDNTSTTLDVLNKVREIQQPRLDPDIPYRRMEYFAKSRQLKKVKERLMEQVVPETMEGLIQVLEENKTLKCKYCRGVIDFVMQRFSNGTDHVRKNCSECDRFNGYIARYKKLSFKEIEECEKLNSKKAKSEILEELKKSPRRNYNFKEILRLNKEDTYLLHKEVVLKEK